MKQARIVRGLRPRVPERVLKVGLFRDGLGSVGVKINGRMLYLLRENGEPHPHIENRLRDILEQELSE
jgi:hypothetical protein